MVHSIARILPAHPAPGPTIDFAYIAPYAHSIPKSPKRIARNLSNAHCAQYAKQPIARYMHFGQNNIARNAQNAYSAVYAFWPKIHCAVYAFWPKTHCAQSAKPTKNTSQARNMHLFMSTIVIVTAGAAYATFLIFVHIACNAHLAICPNESRCTGRAICTGRATNISPFAICVTMVYICALHVHIARNLHIHGFVTCT